MATPTPAPAPGTNPGGTPATPPVQAPPAATPPKARRLRTAAAAVTPPPTQPPTPAPTAPPAQPPATPPSNRYPRIMALVTAITMIVGIICLGAIGTGAWYAWRWFHPSTTAAASSATKPTKPIAETNSTPVVTTPTVATPVTPVTPAVTIAPATPTPPTTSVVKDSGSRKASTSSGGNGMVVQENHGTISQVIVNGVGKTYATNKDGRVVEVESTSDRPEPDSKEEILPCCGLVPKQGGDEITITKTLNSPNGTEFITPKGWDCVPEISSGRESYKAWKKVVDGDNDPVWVRGKTTGQTRVVNGHVEAWHIIALNGAKVKVVFHLTPSAP